MNWKVMAAIGAVVGGAFWAVQRRSRRGVLDPAPWAETTDSVTRFGGA